MTTLPRPNPWDDRPPDQQADIDAQVTDHAAKRAADPHYAYGDDGEWDAPKGTPR